MIDARAQARGVSAALRVTMLTMPKNAFEPYSDDTGPRMTSMRATSSIETKLSKLRPAKLPHDSLTVAPSMRTRMRVLKSPGTWSPRMPAEYEIRLSLMYTPATPAIASPTVR